MPEPKINILCNSCIHESVCKHTYDIGSIIKNTILKLTTKSTSIDCIHDVQTNFECDNYLNKEIINDEVELNLDKLDEKYKLTALRGILAEIPPNKIEILEPEVDITESNSQPAYEPPIINAENVDSTRSIIDELPVGGIVKLHHSVYGDIPFEVVRRIDKGMRPITTLVSVDVITTRPWNSLGYTNYSSSDIREWLNCDFYEGLDCAKWIRQEEKIQNVCGRLYNDRTEKRYDYCWLLSVEELDCKTFELHSLNKTIDGKPVKWWLRNPCPVFDSCAYCVNEYNNFIVSRKMDEELGVVVGLSI